MNGFQSLCITLLLTLPFGYATAQLPSVTIEPMGRERLFCYTNKQSAFYCGVLNGPNDSGFQGITMDRRKLFEQYWIKFGNRILDPATATTVVTPLGFRRHYMEYNTVEEVFFADSLTLLSVSITTEFSGDVMIYPGWSPHFEGATEAMRAGRFTLTTDVHCVTTVIGLQGGWEATRKRDAASFGHPSPLYMPLFYWGETRGGHFDFIVEFSKTQRTLPDRNRASLLELQIAKRSRIEKLLMQTAFTCSDEVVEKAFDWIACSMDALIMQQSGDGIYAGLPHSDAYLTRETFISLPGALLSTGDFETARAVLVTFIRSQNTDTSSSDYGRISSHGRSPGIVDKTMDAAPWMFRQTLAYILQSGDTGFAAEVLPALRRAVDGARRYRIDEKGFVIHGNAETWMDAVGPDGPWSPRGNRAVEVQTLWIVQLEASAEIAAIAGNDSLALVWNRLAADVRLSFAMAFTDPASGTLADHLLPGGERDMSQRPNVLLALTLPSPALVDETIAAQTLLRTFEQCVYPYGVASLSQNDERFHPWHLSPRNYPKDAARHNGTVWSWLSGVAVTALCDYGLQDSAWALTASLARLAMEQAAVGSIPECTDAITKNGSNHLNSSVTFSHAPANAEFIRNMSDNYLGARPLVTDGRPRLMLSPRLPSGVKHMGMNIRVASQRVRIDCDRRKDGALDVRLKHLSGDKTVEAEFDDSTSLSLEPSTAATHILQQPNVSDIAAKFRFCEPLLNPDLVSIKAPDHKLLDGKTITLKNPDAAMIFDCDDPAGDDRGRSGSYTYPASKLFAPGILDIMKVTVRADDKHVYFSIRMKALSQPGWHPEYGFQLTMLTLLIDESHAPEKQSTEAGHKSGYTLPPGKGYDRLILIGGGIRVEDAGGTILAEYIPVDKSYAFGDVQRSTISFALPLKYFDTPPRNWNMTVISGAQDDHGGGGIGEYRDVQARRSEWNGGGKKVAGDNVYDVLECR